MSSKSNVFKIMLLPIGLHPSSIPQSPYPAQGSRAGNSTAFLHSLLQPACSQPSPFMTNLPTPEIVARPGLPYPNHHQPLIPTSHGFVLPMNPFQVAMPYPPIPTVSSYSSSNLKIKNENGSPVQRKSQSPAVSPKNSTKLFRPWQTDEENEESQSSTRESLTPDSNRVKQPESDHNVLEWSSTVPSGEFSPPRICGSRNDKVVVRSDDPFLKQQSALEIIATNLGKSRDGGHRCIYCGKVYSRKYGLKIHLRTHTGFKPLKCKVCDRAFGDPSNLNKHTRLHAENGLPFKCHLCGKVLVRKRDLDRHLVSRHDCPSTATTVASDEDTVPEDELIEELVDVESP